MSIKVMVLGNTGMLGHMVLKVLSDKTDLTVFGTHISNCQDPYYFDAEDGLDLLKTIFKDNKGFDFIINCIGITADKIKYSDSASIIRALKINSIFPHLLAELAQQENSRVLQISTDGVFSGTAEFYYENSPHDCCDIYGKTKSLGEVYSDNFLNIRCSIVGPSPIEKRGLLEWFKSQPNGSTISGYTDHIWNGVTTLQFAELCQKIIETNKFDNLRKESAVFHFAPNESVSKNELLNIFKDTLGKDITVKPIVQGDPVVRRILSSRYKGLKQLVRHNLLMEDEIKRLIKICK